MTQHPRVPLVLWLLTLCLTLSACGTGNAGTSSTDPHQPAGELSVSVSPSNAEVTVRHQGQVVAQGIGSSVFTLPPAVYTVHATAAGYDEESTIQQVHTGEAITVAVVLEPAFTRMQFDGEWLWVTVLPSGMSYAGYLSISVAQDDWDDWRGVEGGVWRRCSDDLHACPAIDGFGFTGSYQNHWVAVLASVDHDGQSRSTVVAIDSDGAPSKTAGGLLLFAGTGRSMFDNGAASDAGFVMARVAAQPRDASRTVRSAANTPTLHSEQLKQQVTNASLEAAAVTRLQQLLANLELE